MFVTLFLIILGCFSGLFLRALFMNTTEFDALLWLRFDLRRLIIGLFLCIIVWAIQTFAPEAMPFLAALGLEVSNENAVITGGGIATLLLMTVPNTKLKN